MRIESSLRFRPFSHLPGSAALIPGSAWAVTSYPAKLEFENLNSHQTFSLDLSLTGLVDRFTLLQDLEKRAVLVFGTAKEGYLRLMITHRDKKLQVSVKRAPTAGVKIGDKLVKSKDVLTFSALEQHYLPPFIEHLSLGCHKAQDMELMRRRLLPEELIPFWFRLGQLTPKTSSAHEEGTLTLLHPLADLIYAEEKLKVLEPFLALFSAGFKGIFVPRLVDEDFQGIAPKLDEPSADVSPLTLLTEGAQLIRALFFLQKGISLSFLPCLPPDFHAGRLLNLHAAQLATIDMEWSKKNLRRLIIRPLQSKTVTLHFQKKIKTYRLRSSERDRGQTKLVSENVDLEKGKTLYLDHFEK